MKQNSIRLLIALLVIALIFSIVMADEILETVKNIINKDNLNPTKAEDSINKAEVIEPTLAEGMPKGVYLEILPRVELLSGVLSQTSWMDIRGPMGEGNEYFQDLKEFFSKYKDHDAVKIAEKLTQKGFTYDAPVYFIINLEPLPNLERHGKYSDYLIRRAKVAGGEKILEEFRLALIDLANKSDFKSFYEAHRKDYKVYLGEVSKKFTPQKIIYWQREFFGWEGSEYHTVLAPAMFPGGGYGVLVEKDDGEIHIYEVIRESGVSSGKVYFNVSVINKLSLHEWGHSFVNPSLEEKWHLFKGNGYDFQKFYKPVESAMKIQAYGPWTTFFNEQVLRAVEAIAYKDFYGESHYRARIKEEEKRGFYLTEFTAEQLEYYRANRDKYKTFKDFVPYLLEQYHKNQDQLLKLVKN